MNFRDNNLASFVITLAAGPLPSASNRSRAGWLDWLPLAMLPPAAIILFAGAEPWVLMWGIAFAMYFGCKWLTWRRARTTGTPALRDWAYLLLWPGMDARAFLGRNVSVTKPAATTWIAASATTIFGAILLWGIAGRVPASHPLLRGWTGMAGVIFLLHFGLFRLLALMWQDRGINARPMMHTPILAESLADFWGRRWNSAFQVLAHDLVFRPLHRRIGAAAATMMVFLVSGFVHDLIISLPARGGYGLPTGYFLLQGAGLLFERSRVGRKIGLGGGMRGRIFTISLTALPAFWLFHPLFVKTVILPMLHAFGAT